MPIQQFFSYIMEEQVNFQEITSAIFQLYHGENKLIFNDHLSNFSAISWREQVNFQWNDDKVHFVPDQHTELDFYSASSLKQQSAGRHVAPLGHIILISNQIYQSVFALSP